MIKLGPEEIAKYPFVEDAGSYIRDIGFTLHGFTCKLFGNFY